MQNTQHADYISAHRMHLCVCVCVHDCVGVQMQHAAASHVEHCMDSIMQSTLQVKRSAANVVLHSQEYIKYSLSGKCQTNFPLVLCPLD